MRDLRRDGIPHGNLPLELDAFVGRAPELAELARALDTGRLVTVTGTGGVGKSRLAARAAAALAPPRGVARRAGTGARRGVRRLRRGGGSGPGRPHHPAAARDAARASRRAGTAARPGRRRARGGGVRVAHGRTAGPRPGAAGAGGGPQAARRARGAGGPAGAAAPGGGGGAAGGPGRAAARGCRVRRRRPGRGPGGGARAVPAPGRDSAGDRAGGGPAGRTVAAADAAAPGRPLPHPDRRGPHRAPPAPDAAHGDRLEPRAVHARGAAAVGAAVGVHGLVRPGGGRVRVQR